DLLYLVAADLLDAAELERAHVDAAPRELAHENVGHLLELEVVVRVERELLVLVLDARIRALEVEPRGKLLVGLVDRVSEHDLNQFGDDVEGRHGGRNPAAGFCARAKSSSARIPDFTPRHRLPCRASCTTFPSARRSASRSPADSTRAPRCTGCARRVRFPTPTRRISASPTSPTTTTSPGAQRATAPKQLGSSTAALRWSPRELQRCRPGPFTFPPRGPPTSTRRRSGAPSPARCWSSRCARTTSTSGATAARSKATTSSASTATGCSPTRVCASTSRGSTRHSSRSWAGGRRCQSTFTAPASGLG